MKIDYTVERILFFTDELQNFLDREGSEISKLFDDHFDYRYAAVKIMIEKGIFLIGRRNGEIRGLHISWLSKSSLDTNIKILQQQLFYVKPDSGRMAWHLFQKFIDIGKTEANHIITMLTSKTNIKPATLKKWGFKELEVLYRLEIK